ncbi:acyl-CoA thioesterase [Janibacter melonis]|uniref:acyl-CoA thioesterase n=1 Tax=Janibacter melonis TaxID=262209 RepID=UPI00355806C3
MTPDFFAHVDLRLADGGMPYTTASTSHMLGWMRFREPTPTFGEEHFVSLADAWPPAVIQMLAQPRPASSLTWTLELAEDVTAEPDAYWAYEVRTDHAGHGYGHTHAHVWRPDGTLVAISRQTVTVFG